MHIANSDRPVAFYSLDVIIGVGYRVNSKRGTQFRIWATRTLKDHLLRGFTVNQRRLQERGLAEMEQTVELLAKTLKSHSLVTGEGQAVLEVVQRYTRAWRLLVEYDEGRLAEMPGKPITPLAKLSLDEARTVAMTLRDDLAARKEAGSLFGQERGHGLAGVLGAIEQTFDGKPLYPSVQARAAHLLYFIIKDHPFGDGNKRLGACSSWSICGATDYCCTPMEVLASPTTRWWRWRCSSRKASPRRKN